MGSDRTKVGIAGVGAMGMGIAKALLARGFAVHVRDIVAAREDEALAAGAKRFPAELDVLVSVVVDAAQTREGIAEHAERAPAFMMCSTIAPQDAEQIAAQLDARGVAMLDAPVSGGPGRRPAGQPRRMGAGGEQ